jgi:phenylpropionate dioxygenase-like ring-hydroxylating dioxygenase large terminal subunit
VVTRGDDGVLRAFHNTCLHRGAAIVSTDGCAKRLTCRYHGWSYGLDGALAHVPEPMSLPKAFDPGTKHLGAVRVGTAWGWVFVNLDARAPSLEASLGPELFDDLANFRVDALVHKGRVDRVGAFDWKVAVEGYLEDYHVPLVHPRSIHPLIQVKHTAMRAWDDHSRMVIALRAPQLYDAPNSAFAPPLPGLNHLQRTTTLVYLVWPSLIVNLLPNHVVTFQVLPVGKNETRVVLDVLGAPTANDVEAKFWEKLCAAYVDFVTEDFTAFTAVQRGLAGPFKPPLNLTHYDQRVRHFRRRVDAWLAR